MKDKVALPRECGMREGEAPAEPFLAAVNARGYSLTVLPVGARVERRISGPRSTPVATEGGQISRRAWSAAAGFTLVELLAVIAIMAIILAAAVPVFQTLGKRDLNTVVFQLRATLRLARQAAVTQRRYVYVVFPDERAANTPDTLMYCLRSYAVVATNRATGRWEYLTDWKFLPKGVYWIDDPSPTFTGNVFRANTPTVNFPTEEGPLRVVSGVCFTPSGRVRLGGTNEADVSFYFATSHFYTTNSSGTALVRGPDIPGVTNAVRVRAKTGQVDFRDMAMY